MKNEKIVNIIKNNTTSSCDKCNNIRLIINSTLDGNNYCPFCDNKNDIDNCRISIKFNDNDLYYCHCCNRIYGFGCCHKNNGLISDNYYCVFITKYRIGTYYHGTPIFENYDEFDNSDIVIFDMMCSCKLYNCSSCVNEDFRERGCFSCN